MSSAPAVATPSSPTDEPFPPTPRAELDAALAELQQRKAAWVATSVPERIEILDEIIRCFTDVGARWAEASREAEGITPATPLAGEEWLVGPYLVLRNLRLLRHSLEQIRDFGRPRIPGPVRTRANGQVTAQVFPGGLYDALFYPGVKAEVWMEPGVTAESLPDTQAHIYRPAGRHAEREGGVALVLGAGNVTSIGPTDALYKFFVENRVVLYKMHPLNAYLGPLLEEGLAPMVERGFFKVVYGGGDVGAYLCDHEDVDEIHITGSDKTVEAIVFGPGEGGAKRKAEHRPKLKKPISAELGNVSAVIVVPGPWSEGDVAYQAENLVSSLANNGGFNCNATRVIVQHATWPQRPALLDGIRGLLRRVPPRHAWYRGADERYEAFLKAHPEAEIYGERTADKLPWAFAPGLDPQVEDDPAFRHEAFCSVFGETGLDAASPAEFLDRAVAFANEVLWGSLNVTLLVHPTSLRDAATAEALERALDNLRFGTISINHWAAVGFGLMSTTWGAYPGHDLYDVQSGMGVVHNTLMFERAQKSVVRAPFKAFPKPPWFVTHKSALGLARSLTQFEAGPSPLKLVRVFWQGLQA